MPDPKPVPVPVPEPEPEPEPVPVLPVTSVNGSGSQILVCSHQVKLVRSAPHWWERVDTHRLCGADNGKPYARCSLMKTFVLCSFFFLFLCVCVYIYKRPLISKSTPRSGRTVTRLCLHLHGVLYKPELPNLGLTSKVQTAGSLSLGRCWASRGGRVGKTNEISQSFDSQ